jgi:dsDNA-specific endonuclease/ATPase MutS2
MIIYCTVCKTEDAEYQKLCKDLIEYIDSLGHTVLAESSSKFKSTFPLTDKQIYKRNLKWIDGAKLMIAEVSVPSLETGFEIAYALFSRKIPVFAIHDSHVQKISTRLAGCDSPLLSIQQYENLNDLKKIISQYLGSIK